MEPSRALADTLGPVHPASLWFSAAVDYAAANAVPLEQLIGGPSMIVHAYIDGQITAMLSRYESTQAEHLRTREQLQLSLLQQALDGNAVLGEREVEAALGLRLDGEHLALALQTDREPAEAGLLGLLTRAVPGSRALCIRHGVKLWLLWLSHPKAITSACVHELREALERAHLRCALGEPARGLAGLGATGRDALETARMQDMLGEDAACVVSFDELRLEAGSRPGPTSAPRAGSGSTSTPSATASARSRSSRAAGSYSGGLSSWSHCGSSGCSSTPLRFSPNPPVQRR